MPSLLESGLPRMDASQRHDDFAQRAKTPTNGSGAGVDAGRRFHRDRCAVVTDEILHSSFPYVRLDSHGEFVECGTLRGGYGEGCVRC